MVCDTHVWTRSRRFLGDISCRDACSKSFKMGTPSLYPKRLLAHSAHLVRVARGEAGARNTCHLQHTAAAQLVQCHGLLKAVCMGARGTCERTCDEKRSSGAVPRRSSTSAGPVGQAQAQQMSS